MATCSLCGFANPDGAVTCQRCSATLGGGSGGGGGGGAPGWGPAAGAYGGPPLGFPPQAYGAPPAPMTAYGAPGALAGLWQEPGGVLVIEKGASLPDRCVKCNAPANGYRLRRKLTWHHPALALLVLVSALIYVIVAMVVRKSAEVDIGLCATHVAKRKTAILIAWGLGLGGLLGLFAGVAADEGLVIAVGVLTSLVGIIWGIVGARVVFPKKIDDHYVWLKGVTPSYLGDLPPMR